MSSPPSSACLASHSKIDSFTAMNKSRASAFPSRSRSSFNRVLIYTSPLPAILLSLCKNLRYHIYMLILEPNSRTFNTQKPQNIFRPEKYIVRLHSTMNYTNDDDDGDSKVYLACLSRAIEECNPLDRSWSAKRQCQTQRRGTERRWHSKERKERV